jgi:hypothetical protein
VGPVITTVAIIEALAAVTLLGVGAFGLLLWIDARV